MHSQGLVNLGLSVPLALASSMSLRISSPIRSMGISPRHLPRPDGENPRSTTILSISMSKKEGSSWLISGQPHLQRLKCSREIHIPFNTAKKQKAEPEGPAFLLVTVDYCLGALPFMSIGPS